MLKKYVERKREEFIYKTEVIDYIYNYIMYSIMLTSKSLKGAKKAMLFADDYCADINIPIRYAISSNDKYINDIINYYYLLGGKDVECFANYFENQDKLIKFKYKIKLSDIVKAKSKTKIK